MKFHLVRAMLIGAVGIMSMGGVVMSRTTDVYAARERVAQQETIDTGTKPAESPQLNDNEEEPKEEEPEIVVADVDTYLHVRKEPHLGGEIVGKLYRHAVGTLVEEIEPVVEENEPVGEEMQDNLWYKIESGDVHGYVKAEYTVRGEEARALAEEVGTRIATVETMTLRMRANPSTESDIVTLLPEGEELLVSEELEDWVKTSVNGNEGYVSADYVALRTENKLAVSIEEERRIAEEAARLEQQRAQQNAVSSGAGAAPNTAGGSGQSAANAGGDRQSAANAAENTGQKAQSTSGGRGREIADFALKFVGNPYVYGGTSLTNGADCSGFVMSVYQNFGISLPRTSGEQSGAGTAVSGLENAKAGDLICYSGHIGIYIGNGQIVHASTPSSGIKVSKAAYKPILSIRRIV